MQPPAPSPGNALAEKTFKIIPVSFVSWSNIGGCIREKNLTCVRTALIARPVEITYDRTFDVCIKRITYSAIRSAREGFTFRPAHQTRKQALAPTISRSKPVSLKKKKKCNFRYPLSSSYPCFDTQCVVWFDLILSHFCWIS